MLLQMHDFLHLPINNGIAVGVSGGSDSISLIILLNEWCQKNNLKLYALTVDHKLRPESNREALLVKKWMDQHNIEHHIIEWNHQPIYARKQEIARKARYDLMIQWCLDRGVKILATAHHKKDQWETFMMRLSKGSGLKGLCAIKKIREIKDIFLIRPFLDQDPDDLKKYLQSKDQPFIEDPSNQDKTYERIRWRQNYDGLAKMKLDMNIIHKTCQLIKEVNELIEDLVSDAKRTIVWDAESQTFNLEPFLQLNRVIAKYFLQNTLQKIGGTEYPCSQDSLSSLYLALSKKDFKAATLSKCLIKYTKGGIIKIQKEES